MTARTVLPERTVSTSCGSSTVRIGMTARTVPPFRTVSASHRKKTSRLVGAGRLLGAFLGCQTYFVQAASSSAVAST